MDPTRPTADTCLKNRKILERNYPRKKNEKFSEKMKKNQTKKLKETFSLTLVSALSELQG